MAGVLLLGVAVLLCASIVAYGPAVAESLIRYLPATAQQNMAAIETLFSIVIFGGLLLFAAIGGAVVKRSAFQPGRAPAQAVAAGLALGLAGVLLATLLAAIAGSLRSSDAPARDSTLLAWGIAVVLLQIVSEEAFFRGWLQPMLVARWGRFAGIAVAALAFAALHVMGGARSPISLVNLFLGGLLFGFLAAHYGGIAAAAGAHFAWNASEQLLLGLDPNPGLGSFGAWLDLELAGVARWGGSDEGLNASVGMTFALLALLAPLWILTRPSARPFARSAQPAE